MYYKQNKITRKVNESILHERECTIRYAHVRKVFQVQLYKNEARALLSLILCILNSDWLRHTRGECGVYDFFVREYFNVKLNFKYLGIGCRYTSFWFTIQCSSYPVLHTWTWWNPGYELVNWHTSVNLKWMLDIRLTS